MTEVHDRREPSGRSRPASIRPEPLRGSPRRDKEHPAGMEAFFKVGSKLGDMIAAIPRPAESAPSAQPEAEAPSPEAAVAEQPRSAVLEVERRMPETRADEERRPIDRPSPTADATPRELPPVPRWMLVGDVHAEPLPEHRAAAPAPRRMPDDPRPPNRLRWAELLERVDPAQSRRRGALPDLRDVAVHVYADPLPARRRGGAVSVLVFGAAIVVAAAVVVAAVQPNRAVATLRAAWEAVFDRTIATAMRPAPEPPAPLRPVHVQTVSYPGAPGASYVVLAPAEEAAAPERAPAQNPKIAAPIAQDELDALLARATAFLTRGDLATARVLLEHVAATGDANVLMVLGSTYDPAMIERLGVRSLKPDVIKARRYYEQALRAGMPAASQALAALARTDQR